MAAKLREYRRTMSSARKFDPVSLKEEVVRAESLRKGNMFVCEANDLIPANGEILEGTATVNESAITGESAPVIREAAGRFANCRTRSSSPSPREPT